MGGDTDDRNGLEKLDIVSCWRMLWKLGKVQARLNELGSMLDSVRRSAVPAFHGDRRTDRRHRDRLNAKRSLETHDHAAEQARKVQEAGSSRDRHA